MKKTIKYGLLLTIPLLLAGTWFLYPKLISTVSILAPGKSAKKLHAERIHYMNQSFDVVKVNPKEMEVRLYWKDSQGHPYGSFDALSQDLAAQGKTLRFATNAGIFSEDFTPGGLHIEDGNELKSLNLREGGGNFHMKPNGVFALGAEGATVVESQAFQESGTVATMATQSGPMLVIDGELHPAFRKGSENKFIRNGVGVDDDGNIWFAISNERVNFYDFAMIFKERLGCPEALYLDGSISGFYLPEMERNDYGSGFCGILAIVE